MRYGHRAIRVCSMAEVNGGIGKIISGKGSTEMAYLYDYTSGGITQTIYDVGDLVEAKVQEQFFVDNVGGAAGVIQNIAPYLNFETAAYTRTATTIAFDNDTHRITDSGSDLSKFVGDAIVLVAGAANAGNNGLKRVSSVGDGYLQLNAAETLTTEAAGNSVTLTLAQQTAGTSGVNYSVAPNANTEWISDRTAVTKIRGGGNSPRNGYFALALTVNNSIAGTQSVKVRLPMVRKLVSNYPINTNTCEYDTCWTHDYP